MRTVSGDLLNAINSDNRTICARLKIVDVMPRFTAIPNNTLFGRNLLTDDNAITPASDYTYDATILQFSQSGQTHYVLFRAIQTSDGKLRYWAADTLGRNTNGWVDTGVNISGTRYLSINPNNGSVYYLESGTLKRRALQYTSSWVLGNPETVSRQYTNSEIHLAHSNNPALDFVAAYSLDTYYNIECRHYLSAIHPNGSQSPAYHAIKSKYTPSAYKGSVYMEPFNVAVASVYDQRVDAEWVMKPTWTPSSVSYTQTPAKYCRDYFFIQNRSVSNIAAIPIRPNFIGGPQSVFPSDIYLEDVSLNLIDAISWDDNIILMVMYVSPYLYAEGASDTRRVILAYIARNLRDRPLSFDFSRPILVSSDTTNHPYRLRFVPYQAENKLLVIGFKQYYQSYFYEFFGTTPNQTIGEIQSITINHGENRPLDANIKVDIEDFDAKIAQLNISPNQAEYVIEAGYNQNYAPIGKFDLLEYSKSEGESGKTGGLNLVSSGLGRLGNSLMPMSVEFRSSDFYVAKPSYGNMLPTQAWFRHLTLSNGSVTVTSNGATASAVGQFTDQNHLLYNCAIMYFNSPPSNSGHVGGRFSSENTGEKWGLVARYTVSGGYNQLVHRGILFLYKRSENKFYVYMFDTSRNPHYVEIANATPSVDPNGKFLHLINQYPGKYVLFINNNGNLVKVFDLFIQDKYGDFYVDPYGYYGLVLYRANYTTMEWREIACVYNNPVASNTLLTYYSGSNGWPSVDLIIPLDRFDDSFLNLTGRLVKIRFPGNEITRSVTSVRKLLADGNPRQVSVPIGGEIGFYDSSGTPLGGLLGAFCVHSANFNAAAYTSLDNSNRALFYFGIPHTQVDGGVYSNATTVRWGVLLGQNQSWYWQYTSGFYIHKLSSLSVSGFYPNAALYMSSFLTINPTGINAISYTNTVVPIFAESAGLATSSARCGHAYFMPGNYTHNVADAIRNLGYLCGVEKINVEKFHTGYTSDKSVSGSSIVLDGYIYPSPSSSEAKVMTSSGYGDRIEIKRDRVVCRWFTIMSSSIDNYDIGNNSIKRFRIIGNDKFFSVYIEGTFYFAIDNTAPLGIVGQAKDLYLDQDYLCSIMDNHFVDVGSNPFQIVTSFLSERSIRAVDKSDGSILFYFSKNGEVSLGASSKFRLVSSALRNAPITHVRAVSDVFADEFSLQATANYGYRFGVSNAETIIGFGNTRNFAKNILAESASKTNLSTYTGKIDYRLEPGDLITFSGQNAQYNILSLTMNIIQQKDMADGNMSMIVHPKVNYSGVE